MCVEMQFLFIQMEKWKHQRRRRMRRRNCLYCFVGKSRYAGILSKVNIMLQNQIQPREDKSEPKQSVVIVIPVESWSTTSTLMRGETTEEGRNIFPSVRLVLMMGQTCRQEGVQERISTRRKREKDKRRAQRERRFEVLNEPKVLGYLSVFLCMYHVRCVCAGLIGTHSKPIEQCYTHSKYCNCSSFQDSVVPIT